MQACTVFTILTNSPDFMRMCHQMRQNKSILITACAKYFCHITYLTLTQLNMQQYFELIYQPYHIEEFDNSVKKTYKILCQNVDHSTIHRLILIRK